MHWIYRVAAVLMYLPTATSMPGREMKMQETVGRQETMGEIRAVVLLSSPKWVAQYKFSK